MHALDVDKANYGQRPHTNYKHTNTEL